jgi:hypothetical protein
VVMNANEPLGHRRRENFHLAERDDRSVILRYMVLHLKYSNFDALAMKPKSIISVFTCWSCILSRNHIDMIHIDFNSLCS